MEPHEYRHRHRAEGDGICRCGKPSSDTIHDVGNPNSEPEVTYNPDELGVLHVGHHSRFTASWWCDTCNSPYCDLL